jgi:RNA recognition motif-containing protein
MAGHFSEMEPKTLFVSNINYNTTIDGLRDAFSRFGAIAQCRILTDRFRGQIRSRGIGFVEFNEENECTACVESKNPITIDGREVRVQKARVRIPRKRDTAFVGGIPEGTTPDDLKAAFTGYNPIDARIAHVNNASRQGFGFVKFATSDDQERAVKDRRTLPLKGAESIVRFARRDFDAPATKRFSRRPGAPRRAPRPGAGGAPPGATGA